MGTRVLNRSQRYGNINWNNVASGATGFKLQLEHFYFAPTERLLEDDDGLFMAVALTCILIDTLAQYEDGAEHSTKGVFMSWLREWVPGARERLPVAIECSTGKGKILKIEDYAAAVYHGYRCGILHEAHPYMFCGIAGQYRAIKNQETTFTCHLRGLTEYEDGAPCPTVVVDATKFLSAVRHRFNAYFDLLVSGSPEGNRLMVNFNRKFRASHGIDIGNDH
ncbi:MAG: hypothetical protein KJ070_01145 [Verrucomicrobia bacterium]|nr:hypothetical protein [Verrucomicrobiota bacterium]